LRYSELSRKRKKADKRKSLACHWQFYIKLFFRMIRGKERPFQRLGNQKNLIYSGMISLSKFPVFSIADYLFSILFISIFEVF